MAKKQAAGKAGAGAAASGAALAGASDPPNAFGQLHKTANWGTDRVSGSPVPPGHRDLTNSPYPGNPGEHISMVVHQIKAGDLQFLGIYNWGDFIAFGKATL
jgi:hypothetical protein